MPRATYQYTDKAIAHETRRWDASGDVDRCHELSTPRVFTLFTMFTTCSILKR